MDLNLNVILSLDQGLRSIFRTLVTDLSDLKQRIMHMADVLEGLRAQVAANSVAIDSAITLINGIAERIRNAGVDPVALQALAAELDTKDQALAAAVLANTPEAPQPQV